jgi:hypothetical protein
MFPLIDFIALLFGFGLLALWEKGRFNDEGNRVTKSWTPVWIFVTICFCIVFSYNFLFESFEREKLIQIKYEITSFQTLTHALAHYYRFCLVILVVACVGLSWLWYANERNFTNPITPRTWSSGKIRTYLYYFGLLQIGILVCLHSELPEYYQQDTIADAANFDVDKLPQWIKPYLEYFITQNPSEIAKNALFQAKIFYLFVLFAVLWLYLSIHTVYVPMGVPLTVWLILGIFILYKLPIYTIVPYLIASFFIFSIWLLFNTGMYVNNIDWAFRKKHKPTLWQFLKSGYYDESEAVREYLSRNFKYSSDVRNHLRSFKPNQFLADKQNEQAEIEGFTGTELLELSLAYKLDSKENHEVFFAAKAETLSKRLFEETVTRFKSELPPPLDNFKTEYPEFEQYEKLRLSVVESIIGERPNSSYVFAFMTVKGIQIGDEIEGNFEEYSFRESVWHSDDSERIRSIYFPIMRRGRYRRGAVPDFGFVKAFSLLKHLSIKLNNIEEFNRCDFNELWDFNELESVRLDSLTLELPKARISRDLRFNRFRLLSSLQISPNFLPCFNPDEQYNNLQKLVIVGTLQADSQLQEIWHLTALTSLDLSQLEISHGSWRDLGKKLFSRMQPVPVA